MFNTWKTSAPALSLRRSSRADRDVSREVADPGDGGSEVAIRKLRDANENNGVLMLRGPQAGAPFSHMQARGTRRKQAAPERV